MADEENITITNPRVKTCHLIVPSIPVINRSIERKILLVNGGAKD